MGVDETCRGQGVGRSLMGGLIEAARARGVRRIRIETNSSLAAANALYRKCGFEAARDQSSQHGYARADVFLELELSAGP